MLNKEKKAGKATQDALSILSGVQVQQVAWLQFFQQLDLTLSG